MLEISIIACNAVYKMDNAVMQLLYIYYNNTIIILIKCWLPHLFLNTFFSGICMPDFPALLW